MSLTRFKIGIVIPVLLIGLFAACEEHRDIRTESHTVALEGATQAEVTLHMGAGELNVRGSSQMVLLEASFEFNRERHRPEIGYRVLGDKGLLEVRHARRRGFSFGTSRNRWDLALGSGVPLDLDIDLGAGRGNLDLRGLRLQQVDISMGVGEVDLDLRGSHAEGFRVKIDGGVGSGRIVLPSEAGVRVHVDGGLGSINTRGLTKQGGIYVNEAFGKSPVTIEVDINAGIGSLDLRCEPSARIKA